MTNKLKNVALILLGVVIILLVMDYAQGKLSDYMTEYNTTGYSIKLTK